MDREELLDLETKFWKGDAPYYDEALADEAVMVFAEPVGVLDRGQTVASISESPRWSSVRLHDSRIAELAPGVALVTYRAEATRADLEAPYVARASSIYVSDGNSWKLAFHQQTPAT